VQVAAMQRGLGGVQVAAMQRGLGGVQVAAMQRGEAHAQGRVRSQVVLQINSQWKLQTNLPPFTQFQLTHSILLINAFNCAFINVDST
jgi:predicted metalloprotease with PDZ domain